MGCANSIAFGDRAVVEAVVGELGKPGRANLAWRIDDVDPAAPTRNDRPSVRGQLDILDEIQSRGECAIQEDPLPALWALSRRADLQPQIATLDFCAIARPVLREGDELDFRFGYPQ